MRAQPRLKLSQRQRLSLTPAMRGALGILRLPTEALIEEVIRASADNPFLEIGPSGAAYDFAVATAEASEGMSLSLARQIDLQRLLPPVRTAALLIVTELREDGYLDASLEELAAEYDVALADLEAGLRAVQSCEPTGIGARTLAEHLKLQLIEKGYDPGRAGTIVAHLEDIAAGRTARLQRALGCGADEVAGIVRALRGLTTAPITAPADPAHMRPPELMVLRDGDGKLTVTLNDASVPSLRALDSSGVEQQSDELAALAHQARGLVQALAQRSHTLLRIGTHILEAQPGYFLRNPPSLSPQRRAEAAAALDLHPSTLSRALAGKSLAYEGRSIPLAAFFQRALPTADGEVSAFDIQARIRALVLAEDRSSPLADEKIVEILNQEGVDIARRTVAKYRKCLRIPSSHERRRRT